MNYLGDFAEDATVYVYFSTHAATGAPVAPSSAFETADVVIYKNGSGTQKATANGLTMTSPFDSVTGLHLLAIDTSVDTGDSGFWTTGADYTVILSPDETVDSLAVLKVLATFSIDNRTNAGIRTDTEDIQSRLPAALTGDGMMKADVQYVNSVEVVGTGATGDEWGPA